MPYLVIIFIAIAILSSLSKAPNQAAQKAKSQPPVPERTRPIMVHRQAAGTSAPVSGPGTAAPVRAPIRSRIEVPAFAMDAPSAPLGARETQLQTLTQTQTSPSAQAAPRDAYALREKQTHTLLSPSNMTTNSLRQLVVMKEILDKPIARRPRNGFGAVR